MEPRPPLPLRVTSGFDLLDQWSEHATQIEKNIIHQVLMAVVDRSVFRDYLIVDDVTKTMEFIVMCKCDLAVKMRIHAFEACGIVYIGPACAVPGLDQAAPEPGLAPGTDVEVADVKTEQAEEQDAPHWI